MCAVQPDQIQLDLGSKHSLAMWCAVWCRTCTSGSCYVGTSSRPVEEHQGVRVRSCPTGWLDGIGMKSLNLQYVVFHLLDHTPSAMANVDYCSLQYDP